MRHTAAFAAATLCLLLALPVAADPPGRHGPRPVSGTVTQVDAASRTLSLGDETFFVPADVLDLSQIGAGSIVIVYWETQGSRRVATQVEHRSEGG